MQSANLNLVINDERVTYGSFFLVYGGTSGGTDFEAPISGRNYITQQRDSNYAEASYSNELYAGQIGNYGHGEVPYAEGLYGKNSWVAAWNGGEFYSNTTLNFGVLTYDERGKSAEGATEVEVAFNTSPRNGVDLLPSSLESGILYFTIEPSVDVDRNFAL